MYADIVNEGCFYCSRAPITGNLELIDYETDHCIDVCAERGSDESMDNFSPLVTPTEWAYETQIAFGE